MYPSYSPSRTWWVMTLIYVPQYCTWSNIVYYHFHVTPQQNQIHAFFSCNINWQMWCSVCTCRHLSPFEVNGRFPGVTSMAHIWLGWMDKTTGVLWQLDNILKPPTICKGFLNCFKCKIIASWFESCLIWGKVPPLHCYLKVCGSETMSYMPTELAEKWRGSLLKKIKNWKGGEILLLYQELCSQVEINTHLPRVKLKRSVLCVNACSSPAVQPPQGRRPDNTN